MNYLENSYEDLDEESKQAAEDIEAMLRSCMLRKGITPKPKLFKEQYQQKSKSCVTYQVRFLLYSQRFQ